MTKKKRAMYPGTFDPITNGHVDVIHRASRLFDELVIAVAEAHSKNVFFTLAERTDLALQAVGHIDNVSVVSFNGLLAEEFGRRSADVIIRGLRAVSDFEYELMMALMNRKLTPDFETVFLMPSEQYIYLHSSLVREVFELGGDISGFVPRHVIDAFERKGRPGT
jgi:pantetheine-phosphate adenylyltransferase